MDLSRVRTGELLTLVASVGLLAICFTDWFGSTSGWDSLTFLRVPIAATALLGLILVAVTVTARPVAVPVAAAVITVGVTALTAIPVAYRVLLNHPGSGLDAKAGAYGGLALLLGIGAGAWRALQDERTATSAARRQTADVLRVRGGPRPAPPARDPSRPAPPAST